jgi:hypothetical protein
MKSPQIAPRGDRKYIFCVLPRKTMLLISFVPWPISFIFGRVDSYDAGLQRRRIKEKIWSDLRCGFIAEDNFRFTAHAFPINKIPVYISEQKRMRR